MDKIEFLIISNSKKKKTDATIKIIVVVGAELKIYRPNISNLD